MRAKEFLNSIAKYDSMMVNAMLEQKTWADIIGESDIEGRINEIKAKRRQVLDIVERLPTDEYEVIYKRFAQGRTYNEIADELSRSVSWVTKKKKSGMLIIQNMLDSEEVDI